MAAKESGEFLHGAVALGAFQGLGDPTSSHWELKAGARMNNVMKIFMVLLEGQIKTLNWHLLLPQVILDQCWQNCGAMAIDDNTRALAKHCPSTFSVVAK